MPGIGHVIHTPLDKTHFFFLRVWVDGLLYLPEIKYRRTLNEAFGPGGWGLAPRGETTITERLVSREWGLVCLGRSVHAVLSALASRINEDFCLFV